jgi:CubicO group peptidase (beta-lactamase class C family)
MKALKHVALLLLLLVVVIRSLGLDTHAQNPDRAAPTLDAIFQKWNKPDVPGCAVGVVREGVSPLVRSYGSADLEHNVAINADTVFEAGSVSKQFTAASVLLLAEQGKLALTDDVRKYVPELPDYGWRITINELLSHTSGLRDWGSVEAIAGWPRTSRVYTLTDVLDITARQKSLNYPPGTAYSYTNTGYNLLAIIVERVSKETLAQFSHDHLFFPLRMSHTQWRDDFRRVVTGRAIAYEAGEGGYEQEMPFEDAYGNGGLLTTVGDLLRWNDALTAGELGHFVTTELQHQTTLNDGHLIAYARGLFVESYHGVQEIAHDGATAGYRAWLGRYPEAHLSIALLCNAGDANPDSLAHAVADLFLAEPAPPTVVILTADQLAQRAGLFVDLRRGLPLRLEAHGNVLRVSNGPVLSAISPDEFSSGSTTYRFSGNDRIVRETADGDVSEYRRTQPWVPSSAELMQMAGNYTSLEAMATYHVTVTDGHVVATPADRRGAALVLNPIFANAFQFANDQAQGVLSFRRDSKGGVSGFVFRNARVYALPFRRVGDNSQSH